MTQLQSATPPWSSGTNDSGAGTDGTVVDQAFGDNNRDAINDLVHSTTNPTIKPKAIIDEVVTARGNKASLEARFAGVIDADGNLVTPASLVTQAQGQTIVASPNVAVNGDLDDWSAGGSAAPDNFTLTGAGATIARTGPSQADTFSFNTGLNGYTAKLTRAGTDLKLTQAVIASGDFSKMANCKSQKFAVAVKGKTAIASHLRIVVDDGATQTASTYHTGGNAEEHLSVVHTISGSASKLDVYAEVRSSNGDAYVGGFVFVFCDLAASDWKPLSTPPDANATRRGLVSTGAQTWAGAKTLNALATLLAGWTTKLGTEATAALKHMGVLYRNFTQVGNVGGGDDTLMTTTIEANTLDVNNKVILGIAFGSFANGAITKTLKLKFGTTPETVTLVGSSTTTADWLCIFFVIRTGSAAQLVVTLTWKDDASFTILYTSMTRDLTADQTLQCTGTNETDTTNDVVTQKGMILIPLAA